MASRKRAAIPRASSSSTSGSESTSGSVGVNESTSGTIGIKRAKMRQFTKPTFVKWQKEKEHDRQTLSWLRCVLTQDKLHVDTYSQKV